MKGCYSILQCTTWHSYFAAITYKGIMVSIGDHVAYCRQPQALCDSRLCLFHQICILGACASPSVHTLCIPVVSSLLTMLTFDFLAMILSQLCPLGTCHSTISAGCYLAPSLSARISQDRYEFLSKQWLSGAGDSDTKCRHANGSFWILVTISCSILLWVDNNIIETCLDQLAMCGIR